MLIPEGKFRGIQFYGSYELAYIIYHIEVLNIIPTRCLESFSYTFRNKVHSYTPDFISNNGYIEIKGKIKKQDPFKWKQFPKTKKLKLLFRKDLDIEIRYCIQVYGKNYWKKFATVI